MEQEDILDKFIIVSMQKCESLDTLIYNFKQFIVNEVENNSYIENGTLYYVDYKIPTVNSNAVVGIIYPIVIKK